MVNFITKLSLKMILVSLGLFCVQMHLSAQENAKPNSEPENNTIIQSKNNATIAAVSTYPYIVVDKIHFDSIDIDTYQFREFVVANRGTAVLVIDSAIMPQSAGVKKIFSSPNIELMDISKANPLILAPNESRQFTIKFMPLKERYYVDSVTFLSNTALKDSKGKDADCSLNLYGRGIEPEFIVFNHNWGRKRIYRENFPIEPYPLVVPKTNKNSGILYNKSNQVNKIVSITYDSLMVDGIPTFTFDRSKIFGRLLGGFERDTIPVTYFPRKLGGDTCFAHFQPFNGKDTTCMLTGFGVLPKMEAKEVGIFCNSNSNPGNPATGRIEINNLNIQKWEFYDTLYIYDLVEENINTSAYSWEDCHFRYNKADVKFPVKLSPGQSLYIPITYKSESTEPVVGYLTTKSNAIEEISVKVTGYPFGTSVAEVVKDNISLSPNPSNETLHISNLPNNCSKIIIFDESGKEVKRIDIKNQSESFKISTEDLPIGAYILRIFVGIEVLDRKFVILR